MIIIPMAGLSSRFTIEGYKVPKFMLELDGISLFKHSVLSFKKYFSEEMFLFILLDKNGFYDFLIKEIQELRINNFQIVLLDQPTKGQAETVFQGLQKYKGEINQILIFNIDTFRPNYEFPKFNSKVDGFLEVFQGSGDNWSYIKLDDEDDYKVIETAEKNPISNLCCTGLYWFKNYNYFVEAYNYYSKNFMFVNGELYIAPLYNFLISKGYYISHKIINREEVIFCGTPLEYSNLLK